MPELYRVILATDGILESEGPEAARDIAQEFNEIRTPRYFNAVCTFESGRLILSCDNDGWDANGLNLMDEFSDCLSIYVKTGSDDAGKSQLIGEIHESARLRHSQKRRS